LTREPPALPLRSERLTPREIEGTASWRVRDCRSRIRSAGLPGPAGPNGHHTDVAGVACRTNRSRTLIKHACHAPFLVASRLHRAIWPRGPEIGTDLRLRRDPLLQRQRRDDGPCRGSPSRLSRSQRSACTNTYQVGIVRDSILRPRSARRLLAAFHLPVSPRPSRLGSITTHPSFAVTQISPWRRSIRAVAGQPIAEVQKKQKKIMSAAATRHDLPRFKGAPGTASASVRERRRLYGRRLGAG